MTSRSIFFSDIEHNSIEEIRIIATTLLVAYHVIGPPSYGLEIGYPHPLRIFADLLGDFRMPAFAFIAGFVYALRPASFPGYGAFITGKLRRVAVPGLIAVLVFDAASTVMNLQWATPVTALWRLIVFPYAHFWFLQAILALFVIIGFLDAALRQRWTIALFAATTLLCIGFALFGSGWPMIFSLSFAIGLAPYFVLGICFYRHRQWIEARHRPITVAAVIAILIWLVWTVAGYRATGALGFGHRQLQSLLFGSAMVTLLLFYLPHHQIAKTLGRFSFTIYLYHVLGTAGARMLLYRFGVDSLAVHVVFGIAAGLLLPITLHLLALRSPVLARYVLGIRPRAPAPVARLPDAALPGA